MIINRSVPVILSEYMVKTDVFVIRRKFRRGQRRGRNQSPVKVMGEIVRTEPSTEILMVDGFAVMHPATLEAVRNDKRFTVDVGLSVPVPSLTPSARLWPIPAWLQEPPKMSFGYRVGVGEIR